MIESRQEHLRKPKGKPVSVERKSGDQWKAKRGEVMRPSSPAPEPQTQSDGENFRKEKLFEAGVRLGRDLEDCAKTSVEKCTNPSCDSWHPSTIGMQIR